MTDRRSVFREGLCFAALDGEGVVLDMTRDRYWGLGPESAAIWAGVSSGRSLDTIADELAARFSVSPLDAREMLGEQLAAWETEGFLVAPGSGRGPALALKDPGTPAQRQLFAADMDRAGHSPVAYFHLARAALWLRRVRETSLVAQIRGATLATRFRAEMYGPLHRTARAFRGILRFAYAEGECLPRALLLARALRTQGIPCDVCFGVRKLPFWAHAWVEADGSVVSDRVAVTSRLCVVARV